MPVHNAEVAKILTRVADLLEIEGSNLFRVRAYRNAARTVGGLSRSVAEMVDDNESLVELPGIGKDLAGKIVEIAKTGSLSLLEELERRLPPNIDLLLRIPTLGPRRVQVLLKELNVTNVEELKRAAERGKIRSLPGFGEKTEERILREIENGKKDDGRIPLFLVEPVAQSMVEHLRRSKGMGEVIVAGSFRRRQETVGDLDILATCDEDSNIMERFVGYEDVRQVLSHGRTRSTVILRTGLQVDLRLVPQESYGAALHYFTGSQAHNIHIRKLGLKKELKINEYGVFKGDKRIAGRTEEEVYAQVGLPYIEPDLREDRGEIEAAQEGRLPKLVTLGDIRGDLHSHTNDTDGRYSLEEMVNAARERGYEYLAISNHSKHLTVARGLNTERLLNLIERIERLNQDMRGFTILKSIEVDILEDGSLDLPDSVLRELDLTVCSVHYKFNLPRVKQTERIIRAMDNPYFNILGHPTGRLIGERGPYDVDMERIMEAAKERGCCMELNAQPDRLDLTDLHCRLAGQLGVKVAISTDAHSLAGLGNMRFGVWQARRGWLEPHDVLNTRSWADLKNLLKRA